MFRTNNSPFDLSAFSAQQLWRLKCNLWERMTRDDGYQPFGYDSSTLWAVHPGFMQAIASVNLHGLRLLHS
jgi:hypothetical protein